jgi:hypothetical protein
MVSASSLRPENEIFHSGTLIPSGRRAFDSLSSAAGTGCSVGFGTFFLELAGDRGHLVVVGNLIVLRDGGVSPSRGLRFKRPGLLVRHDADAR